MGPNTRYVLSFQLPERCIVQEDNAVKHMSEVAAYDIHCLFPHSAVLH